MDNLLRTVSLLIDLMASAQDFLKHLFLVFIVDFHCQLSFAHHLIGFFINFLFNPGTEIKNLRAQPGKIQAQAESCAPVKKPSLEPAEH